MHMYYRTISVGQEFKHGLTGSFASGPPTRYNQSVIQVGILFEGLSGEGSPKIPWLLAGFFKAVGLRASVSAWLLDPQLLPCGPPCHITTCVIKASKRSSLLAKWKSHSYLASSQKWHSFHLTTNWRLEASPQTSLCSDKAMNTWKLGSLKTHLRICLLHVISAIGVLSKWVIF